MLTDSTSWIILFSVLYTYLINKFTSVPKTLIDIALPPLPPLPIRPRPKPESQISSPFHQRRHTKSRLASTTVTGLIENENSTRRARPLNLLDLPPELVLSILLHCTSNACYTSLILTSKPLYQLTTRACLPHLPVRLVTPRQVASFRALISPRRRAHLSLPTATHKLIRHIWATPLPSQDLAAVVDVVRRCTELRTLATNAYIVQESIHTSTSTVISHPELKELTLLSMRNDDWIKMTGPAHPGARAFLQHLVRLRYLGSWDTLQAQSPTRGLVFKSLAHLSQGTAVEDGSPDSLIRAARLFDDRGRYPVLRTVVVTAPRSVGGLRVSLRKEVPRQACSHGKVLLVEMPCGRSELDLWYDNVRRYNIYNSSGRAIWELCA